MPGETSIALQALLVSLTPTTHISADGHQDNRPPPFPPPFLPPLPPASPATFYPQSSEQHHASEVSLKGVPVHWTPLEGFSEQETTLQGIVAALPVH